MTAIAPEQIPSPWPPPEGCPAWCESQLMHQPERHPEDRVHFGPEHQVQLSLEPGVEQCDGGYRIEYLTVYLRQSQDQDGPRINLSQGELAGVTLTLREAGDVAQALYAAICDTAEKP